MRSLATPIAIVVAGALIAVSLFFISKHQNAPAQTAANTGSKIRDVQATDHVRGNPRAEIKIIEYSDPECPFCKEFQSTMKQIISEYGESGKVAWIYRHYPIAAIHSKGPKEAEALECAAAQGGEAVFWKYADTIYATTPSNNNLEIGVYNTSPQGTGKDAGTLTAIAKNLGLDTAKFEDCLSAGTFASRIQLDSGEAVRAGASGTPFNVILVDGEQIPINGAQPYTVMKGILDAILNAPTK